MGTPGFWPVLLPEGDTHRVIQQTWPSSGRCIARRNRIYRGWCRIAVSGRRHLRAGARVGGFPHRARAVRHVAKQSALGRSLGAVQQAAGLAALHDRPLGLHRGVGLVLDLRGRRAGLGLGHVSLWPLGCLARRGLGLGAWRRMGAGLGQLARQQRLCRLGAAAARRHLRGLRRPIRLLDFPAAALSGAAACAPVLSGARSRSNPALDGDGQSHHAARRRARALCRQSRRVAGTNRRGIRGAACNLHGASARAAGHAGRRQCGQRAQRGSWPPRCAGRPARPPGKRTCRAQCQCRLGAAVFRGDPASGLESRATGASEGRARSPWQ